MHHTQSLKEILFSHVRVSFIDRCCGDVRGSYAAEENHFFRGSGGRSSAVHPTARSENSNFLCTHACMWKVFDVVE